MLTLINSIISLYKWEMLSWMTNTKWLKLLSITYCIISKNPIKTKQLFRSLIKTIKIWSAKIKNLLKNTINMLKLHRRKICWWKQIKTIFKTKKCMISLVNNYSKPRRKFKCAKDLNKLNLRRYKNKYN